MNQFAIAPIRDIRFDQLKFFLIMLVILGHTLELFDLHTKWGFQPLYQLIYLFHMPLFAILSGYFIKYCKSVKKFLLGGGKLIETYLIFQIPTFLIVSYKNGIPDFLTLFSPGWGMWYLLCLIVWRTVMFILPQETLDKKYLMLIVSLLLSISIGFLDINLFAFQRIFTYFPFFLIGYYMNRKEGLDVKFTARRKLYCLATVIVSYLALSLIGINYNEVFYQSYSYWSIGYHPAVNALFRILWYPVCIIVSFAVLPILLYFSSIHPSLGLYGRHTLCLYVGHLFFYKFINSIFKYSPLELYGVDLIPIIVLVCVLVIHIFLFTLIRNGFNTPFTNPITTFYSRYSQKRIKVLE